MVKKKLSTGIPVNYFCNYYDTDIEAFKAISNQNEL